MKVLITGAGGQLASELLITAPEGLTLQCLSSKELDITNSEQVNEKVSAFAPDVIINAAAYTAVDKAEEDFEAAKAVNVAGVKNLAKACPDNGYMLHISTDFVFDGLKSSPYLPDDCANASSVYGKTKYDGELALFEQKPSRSAVIRTSWVYSSHGNNFVKTMLRLMAEKPQLGIVSDQIGTPTAAKSLAKVCWLAVEKNLEGTHHWSDMGVASWYDFAVAIQELALTKGLLTTRIPIKPISSSAYPMPATRPSYSVMNKDSLFAALGDGEAVHWREQLDCMLSELKELKELKD